MTSPFPTEHEAPRTIGDVLLQLGFASDDEIARAIEAQDRTGQPLGQILVEAGAITRLELASALAEQWSAPGTNGSPAKPLSEPALAADATSALAARLEATLGRITTLEGTLDAGQRRLKKLNESADRRLRELESRIDEMLDTARLDALSSRLDTPEGVAGDLDRVRLATRRLGLHLEAHDRPLAELMSSRDVTQRLDELSARIDDLVANGSLAAGSAREGGGSADVTSELRALARRVEQAESTMESEREKLLTRVERTASSVDWRLRRLEAGATSRP